MDISAILNVDDHPTDENEEIDAYPNLVEWTLSSKKYDFDEQILIDADDPSRFVSKRDVSNIVAMLAGMFTPDSTVCLHIPNDILYPVLVLAIWASKCCWTGTNWAYTSHELKRHVVQSDADYLIVTPEDLQSAQDCLSLLRRKVTIIMFTDILESKKLGLPDHPCLHDYLNDADFVQLDVYLDKIGVDNIAVLQSTSGTTGPPKMAVRTHRAMMLESAAIAEHHSAKLYPVRRLWCTPIFHAFSTPEMVINAIRLGIPTYMTKRFDESFARKVHDFRITEIAAPPPMLMRLVQQEAAHRKLHSVRAIYTGGTILSSELRRRVLEMFVLPPRIVQVWGMTEGGWFSTFKYPESDETGSVGRLIPGYDIKIDPVTRLTTADGQEAGELLVKGPQLMTGYHDNTQATAQAFTDGWLRTGDVGYVESGKVYLIDRVKDLIKVNGFQVSPAEIEDALLQSDDIRDAAALSVGSDVDEHPMVFVVVTGAIAVSEIERLLCERLARYKVAQIEIKFMEEIPRNHSGKVVRSFLKAYAFEKGWIE